MNIVTERSSSATVTTQTLGLVLVPEFSMIAFTSLIEPLRLANRVSHQQLYDWKIYSIDGKPVMASNGKIGRAHV